MLTATTMIDPERQMLGEVEVIGRDRWEEIRRRAGEGASIRAIARELELDRKTVRRCLRQTEWKPYLRAARADTLLAKHAEYLRRRAAEVGYSAFRVLDARCLDELVTALGLGDDQRTNVKRVQRWLRHVVDLGAHPDPEAHGALSCFGADR